MSVLNPEHLLAQAAKLIEPPTAGPPRQVDVRRAISSAYYAVFHAILIAAADEIVGAVHRVTANYAVVYRSIDHRQLRTICDIARAKVPPPRYRPFVAGAGFGTDVQTFAGAVMSLQECAGARNSEVRLRPDQSVSHCPREPGDRPCPYCPAPLGSGTRRRAPHISDASAIPAAIGPATTFLASPVTSHGTRRCRHLVYDAQPQTLLRAYTWCRWCNLPGLFPASWT